MKWTFLFLAGFFEVGWTVGLKLMDNHRNLTWSVIFYLSIVTSFAFLQKALETIPVGTAYAIYTGIGAIGTVLAGIFFFREEYSFLRLFFLGLLVFSIAGLKFTAVH
ncbi:MAG: multidrug efflux SMR transporter [Ferruginibacter sp.]|nr:multidrug efflux SMR transporter [Cytophagales bacterium]